jgi:Alginate lyase
MRRTFRPAVAMVAVLFLACAAALSVQPAPRAVAFTAAAVPTPDNPALYSSGSATRQRSSVGGRSPAMSGTAAPGAEAPGAGAAAGTARYPGDLLDLRNWYLTLPTGEKGRPDTVEQPQLATYSSSWFGLDDARDGVVFTANAGGVTTKNSAYPRSELREMNGSEKAAWSNSTGTHILELRQAVLAVPPAKPHVVTAQIHDGSDDVMEVRLEGERLIAQYDDGNENITIDPAYVLGTPYNLRIVAAAGRIDVFYNGERKAEINRSGTQWYYKTGSYLQSNPEKGDRSDAVARVVLYSVRVTHSD